MILECPERCGNQRPSEQKNQRLVLLTCGDKNGVPQTKPRRLLEHRFGALASVRLARPRRDQRIGESTETVVTYPEAQDSAREKQWLHYDRCVRDTRNVGGGGRVTNQ